MVRKPEIAVIDMDFPIYYAAAAAEQVWYVYYDSHYNEVARFKSADEGKGWIEEFDIFGGIDLYGRYNGSTEDLIREVEWEPKSFSVAKSTFNIMKEDWLAQVQCKEWKGKCAAKKGAPVFRKGISTIQEYKGNRKNSRKPHHLDHLRKWALQDNSQLTKVIGPYEADDLVASIGQKLGDKAVVQELDKDVRNVQGCWFHIPGEMERPLYSDPDIIGELHLNKGKMDGFGISHLLAQCLTGDTADNYKGCPGIGPSKAVGVISHFNNSPIKNLRYAVQAVGETYRDSVGDEYIYRHWESGEEVKATWKDVFIENLLLAYMIKSKDDKPFEIIKYIEEM